MNNMPRKASLSFIAAATAILLTPPALLAQASADPKPDSLSGPAVEDRNVPGVSSTFGDAQNRMNRERPVPHRAFMRIIHSMETPDTPENVRLDKEQSRKINAVSEEFRTSMRAFMDKHADELRALRPEGADRPGSRADRPQRARRNPDAQTNDNNTDRPERARRAEQGERARQPDDAQRRERAQRPGLTDEQRAELQQRREKIAEIMKNGPQPADYHTRIWAILTPEQQAFAQERIQKLAEESSRAGAEARRERAPQRNAEPQPGDRTNPRRQGRGSRDRRGSSPNPEA